VVCQGEIEAAEVDERAAAQLVKGIVDLTDLPEPLAVAEEAPRAPSVADVLEQGKVNSASSASMDSKEKEATTITGFGSGGTSLAAAELNQLQAIASLGPPSPEEERATSMDDWFPVGGLSTKLTYYMLSYLASFITFVLNRKKKG
jgi:hypothetical protein